MILDPTETQRICLPEHDHLPKSQKPLFLAKAKTCRGQVELGKEIDELSEILRSSDLATWTKACAECFLRHVSGWENVGDKPLTLDNVLDTLNTTDIRNVLGRLLYSGFVSVEEKKS
ncbi:hypothetical protein VN12_19540 [Pirellula sp. SH-Sr6A]|uniref:hypothetical protein n=1 Tax=Pirellula sp. SH-Sr6A TaxID=1632865 RepID=UPI00078DA8E8|nr:hypothetical protein [Pirellula sp. SH-Sr6A]AMV34328.1 hypothetical protein VN12_19540 [Pirellula sp. SH-Sr6A]